jgi:hypothetical protein
MKTQVIAGAIILGLGAVTLALGQSGATPASARPGPADAPASRSSDRPREDRSELYAAVARLRAEVEVLQLEHDLARARLSSALKDHAEEVESGASQRSAREFMRIGAELVGKGSEFEAALQDKGDQIWRAVHNAVAGPTPAELERLRQDFLRVATDLNRKKIDLVALEVRLDGSM